MKSASMDCWGPWKIVPVEDKKNKRKPVRSKKAVKRVLTRDFQGMSAQLLMKFFNESLEYLELHVDEELYDCVDNLRGIYLAIYPRLTY